MNKKLLVIIGIFIGVALLASFTIPINQKSIPFEIWGNNEHFYELEKGWTVVCDISLLHISSNCQVLNENGEIVAWPPLEPLSWIFANCECDKRVKDNPETNQLCVQPLASWQNSTHYIDNNICQWMEK